MTYEYAITLINQGQQGTAQVLSHLTAWFEQDQELLLHKPLFSTLKQRAVLAVTPKEWFDIGENLKVLLSFSEFKPHWQVAPLPTNEEEAVQVLPTDWRFLLDSLKDGKSVLFLGPNLLTDAGKPLHKFFYEALVQEYTPDKLAYNPQEGFFAFSETRERVRVCQRVADYYRQDASPAHATLYENLARLPFPLFVNFMPTRALHKAFERLRFPFEFAHFDAHTIPTLPAPTRDKPLIYNIFGDCEQDETLVIGYDDLFAYLRGILVQETLPTTLRETINRANNLIFLGFEFDKWYAQILLNALGLQNEKARFLRHALATDVQKNKIAHTLCTKHFHFELVGEAGITEFITKLLQHCTENQSIRR